MKRLMICCVAALAILWAGNVGLAKDRTERREQKKTTREDKEVRRKPTALTPGQRGVAIAKRAIERDLTLLRQMRKTAVEEKAARTVAEIDKAIATKERQGRRLATLAGKRKADRGGEIANRHHAKSAGKAKGKKNHESDK
jgi:hypothetical protein